MSSAQDIARGGTGSVTPAGARKNLGLELGVDVQPYDPGLAAIAAFNTNGFIVQTAEDVYAGRTITGTANEITVTDGDGNTGNPVISLPSALTFTGKIVTGGTYNTGVFSGTFSGPLTGDVTGNLTGDTTGAHNGTVGATTPDTGSFTTIDASGAVRTTDAFYVDGAKVVGNRRTGWTADSGTSKRSANTVYSSVTISNPPTQSQVQAISNALEDTMQTIKALKDDLIAHGLID